MRSVFFVFIMMAAVLETSAQTITGKVTGPKFEPISNASIHLLNTQVNIVTDKNGNYVVGP